MYAATILESIKDILITRLGSRVMRPEYGSRIFELIDKKLDDNFRADLTLYVIEAVERWEKRVKIKEVKITSFYNSKLSFTVVLDSGQTVEVSL